ncbi:bacteriocin-like protein [Chryseobacterium polytrichastri]|uniref:Bacteriocin-type signal sequence-containing protein n=1 Tax=Chryseobacterium polytrichastri TaxID=1302687 RepID=A0A1M6RVY9_9FLAO|nr:bacteriocin-type signal sequence-containing protein [Chryseobacterium polytrichastri]
MKNLKKLDRNELKSISGGDGLLDPVCRLICILAGTGIINLTQVQILLCPNLDCSNL